MWLILGEFIFAYQTALAGVTNEAFCFTISFKEFGESFFFWLEIVDEITAFETHGMCDYGKLTFQSR